MLAPVTEWEMSLKSLEKQMELFEKPYNRICEIDSNQFMKPTEGFPFHFLRAWSIITHKNNFSDPALGQSLLLIMLQSIPFPLIILQFQDRTHPPGGSELFFFFF